MLVHPHHDHVLMNFQIDMDFASLVCEILAHIMQRTYPFSVIALAGHPLWKTEVGLDVGGPAAFG